MLKPKRRCIETTNQRFATSSRAIEEIDSEGEDYRNTTLLFHIFSLRVVVVDVVFFYTNRVPSYLNYRTHTFILSIAFDPDDFEDFPDIDPFSLYHIRISFHRRRFPPGVSTSTYPTSITFVGTL